MTVLVVGAAGLVGRHVVEALRARGQAVIAADRAACDITRAESVQRLIDEHRPDAIVNAAAYTNVDGAEDEDALAQAANVAGPELLARAAAAAGAYFLHYSTDFVFGDDAPHPRTEDEPPSPIGVYATSKAEGEARVLQAHGGAAVVRIGNIYGRAGRNFAARLRELMLADKRLTLDDERRMSPTSAQAVATQTLALLDATPAGIFHVVCEGATTWYEFAQAMAAQLGLGAPDLVRMSRAELAYRVHRPSVVLSRLALARLGLDRMPTWQDALAYYLSTEMQHPG